MDNKERQLQIQTVCLFVLTIIAIAAALYWLQPVMVPFTLALFFTLVLTPFIEFQTKYLKMPRVLALLSTLVVAVLIFGVLSVLVSLSINQMIANADAYQEKVNQLFQNSAAMLQWEIFGINLKGILSQNFERVGQEFGNFIGATINGIITLFSKGILVFIFMLFLLLGKTTQIGNTNKVWNEGEARIKRYISAKFLISAALGVVIGGVLQFLGIDLALVFGLFAFILNFIPSVGPVIATILPLPVVLVSPDISLAVAILAILIPGAIQFTIGNVLEPKVIGESLDLHPVAILMALIFWGMLWGIVGMFLAVPLTAVMKIIFEDIEFAKPIANLLAGRLDS